MATRKEYIDIRGAAEHNLKRISLRIPKNRLVVFAGPSGSGKTSLAFDTIYAEGQRRYIESLSSYARQFLGQMDKPKYDHIRGLSPTISIDQKAASNNPRSTVGTITEVYDYLRVLYARIGRQHCHGCGRAVEPLSPEEISRRILDLPAGTPFMLLARLVENRKGEHRELLAGAVREGFSRFRVDGKVLGSDEIPRLGKNKKHTIDLVVDRLVAADKGKESYRARLMDSVELALRKGCGRMTCALLKGEERLYSRHLHCPHCDIGFPDLSPQSFSFNSPLGMCPDCNGLGTKPEMDPNRIVPDPTLSVRNGAVEPWARIMERSGSWTGTLISKFAMECGIDLDTPWNRLPSAHRDLLLYGSTEKKITVTLEFSSGKLEWARSFEGVVNELYRRFRQTRFEAMRKYYMRYLSESRCSSCGGKRLLPESAMVRLGGLSLPDFTDMTIHQARTFLKGLSLRAAERRIADEVLKEIRSRLGFLVNVGLGYLTLNEAVDVFENQPKVTAGLKTLKDVGMGYVKLGQPSPTLSGGEAQRIKLVRELSKTATGRTHYILDEPTTGLHSDDLKKLLFVLNRLVDAGNTVIVIEHNLDVIRCADPVIDLGPEGGDDGGRLVVAGTPEDVARCKTSHTGRYLRKLL